MNVSVLQGRLTADPEIRDLGGNARMARYTLAVQREYWTNDGDRTDFINCVCFGKPALNAEKYLKKGMLICIRGSIRTGKYKNKEGNMVYTTDVVVDRADFAESKADMDKRIKEEKAAERAAKKEAKNNPPEPVETPREASTQSEPTPVNNRPVPMEDEFMQIPDDFGDEMPFS